MKKRLLMEWGIVVLVFVMIAWMYGNQFRGGLLRGDVSQLGQYGYYGYGGSATTTLSPPVEAPQVRVHTLEAVVGERVVLAAQLSSATEYPLDVYPFYWQVDPESPRCFTETLSGVQLGNDPCLAISVLQDTPFPNFTPDTAGEYVFRLFVVAEGAELLLGEYHVLVEDTLESLADFDGDSRYTFQDLLYLLQHWNQFPQSEAEESEELPYSAGKILTKILQEYEDD